MRFSHRGPFPAFPLALLAACPVRGASTPSQLPLPQLTVARTAAPPTIDGKLAPGEWDRAAACTGFTVAFQGNLSEVQSTAWVTFDERFLYVAMKNWRGARTTLLHKRARKVDDGDIVFDPANEVWFTPPGAPQATYQTLWNAYPGVFDAKKIPSVGYTSMSWSGRWEIAASETANYWVTEARAPIAAFEKNALGDGDTWRALFCTDMGDRYGFRAWAPGGAFEEINRHGWLHFRDNSATFQLLDVESVFTGKAAFPMAVTGPANGQAQVTVQVRFGGQVEPAAGDQVLTKDVTVKANQVERFTLAADLTQLDLPLKSVVVQKKPRETREVPSGFCEVMAKTATGETLSHQVFPFVLCDAFVRHPPTEVRASPYDTPLGVQAFYAPLSKKLLVKIDRYYLPNQNEATTGRARLMDPQSGQVVVERPVAPFYFDYSEFPLDLAGLDVPVETEADWARAKPVRDENKQIAAENKERLARGEPPLPLKPVPGPQPAEYRLQIALTDAAGKQVAETTTPVQLRGYQFEWLPNQVGISDKVIPPWTPVQWRDGQVSMWNKRYRLNGLGLAESVTNAGAPQLSGPMKLVATIDGREVGVTAGKPKATKVSEAGLDLTGTGKAGDLEVAVTTRVEFDGFVLNTMTLAPHRPATVDRLRLVVEMPKREAPCFVTTAGGWAAQHGWTPNKWDSRETALGSMRYKFVPYVFLTDSERGFTCFVDSVKGFKLDPAEPVQELTTEGDKVTFRLNFVTEPGVVQKTTVQYGWMVSPQKPQPHNWRGYHLTHSKPYPEATCLFWCDADWAVLWPYYSSPFPWDYDKSREELERRKANGILPAVGNIAHAIARYQDYKGRTFPELAADWGQIPGNLANGNVARSRGPNDFQLWHWDRWVKKSGLPALYFDETYLSEDTNYLTGGAFLLPDEQVQPGYNYLGLREMCKRLRYLFHENGVPPPNLWFHTTSGHPVYAWMPEVAMEGENVAPTGYDNDYLDCLPASRLRALGMGVNLGVAPTIMCQAQRHWEAEWSNFMVHQFVGWILAHDVLPEQVPFWQVLAPELGLWQDGVRFLPYWKPNQGLTVSDDEVVVSAHVRPDHAVLWVVNTAHEDKRPTLTVDLHKLGLNAGTVRAFDAETGEDYALRNGKLQLAVPQRMWRAVRLMPARPGDTTFLANFDVGRLKADFSVGDPNLRVQGRRAEADPFVAGKSGKGLSLDTAVTCSARHHLAPAAGSVSFQLSLSDAARTGTLLTIGDLRLSFNRGKLQLHTLEAYQQEYVDKKTQEKKTRLAKRWGELASVDCDLTGGWRRLEQRWQGNTLRLLVDGAEVLTTNLPNGFPLPPMGRGLEIAAPRTRVSPPEVTFGPAKGVVVDEVRMGR